MREAAAREGKPRNKTPWACVAEKCCRTGGGGSRQGRGKRRRRKGAGLENPHQGKEGTGLLPLVPELLGEVFPLFGASEG